MTPRAATIVPVVMAVLLVTATGPSAAYESAQAVPALEPLETDDPGDAGDRVSYRSPPTSSGHFATTPPVRSAALERLLYKLALPDVGAYSDPGKGKGTGAGDGNGAGEGNDKGNGNGEGTGQDGEMGSDGDRGNDDTDRGADGNDGQEKGTNGGSDSGKNGDEGKNKGEENGKDKGKDKGEDEGKEKGKDKDSGKEKGTDEGAENCNGHGAGAGPPNGTGASPPTATSECVARGGPLTVEDGDIQLGPNASALAHRQAAITLLAEANATGPGNSGQAFERKRQRALAQLNTTYAHVMDVDRVASAAVFRTDKRVIAPVHGDDPNGSVQIGDSVGR